VVNWTHNEASTRFALAVGVDYNSDIRLVEKVLLDCAANNTDILSETPKAPTVRLVHFGSSSLDFELIFWSDNLFRIEQTKSDLRFDIIEAFLKTGISIPFNQLVLHRPAKIG
jgi:small-conductance mechanosensitive channel